MELDFGAEWDESLLGYIYQIHTMSRRAHLQSRVQQPNKQTDRDDIIAFTQLYTPDWIVDFLLSNVEPPILDPACGSGHFLLRAVDTMLDTGTSMTNALQQIAGCDIDPMGLFITRLSLTIKALQALTLDQIPELNLHDVSSHQLGSLANDFTPDHPLSQKWSAIVGNPPYIGRKLLNRALKDQLKVATPDAHHDLSAAFVSRGLDLLQPGGRLAFITQTSLLYLPSYEKLREKISNQYHIDAIVELGPRVFPLQSGEKVNSMLLIVSATQSKRPSHFLNITDADDKQQALYERPFMERDQNSTSPALSKIIRSYSNLAAHADVRQGLATTDNSRFVRWWWQVPENEIGTRWFPYAKGSGSERWYSPIETVVDWENNGAAIKEAVAAKYPYLKGKTEWVVKNESYYFREGLTFSFVNAKNLAVRVLPDGCIFDVGGSSLFVEDNDETERMFLLGYLNSSFVAVIAQHINPTINFQVGDLKRLPYVLFTPDDKRAIAQQSEICLTIKKSIAANRETTWRTINDLPLALLTSPPDLLLHLFQADLRVLQDHEAAIDEIVLRNISPAAEIRVLAESAAAARPGPKDSTATSQSLAHKILYASLLKSAFSGEPVSLRPDQVTYIEHATKLPLIQYAKSKFITEHARRHHGVPRLDLSISDGEIKPRLLMIP